MFNFFKKKHKEIVEEKVEEKVEPSGKFQFTKVVISATLDQRTCLICGVLDGKVYKADEVHLPPFHTECRCQCLPWIGEQTERPFIDPVEKIRPKEGTSPFYESLGKTPVKMRKGGQTKDSYTQWFDKQKNTETGKKFQEYKLGKVRYEAYVAGKVSLEDLVNMETLEMYSLTELGLQSD